MAMRPSAELPSTLGSGFTPSIALEAAPGPVVDTPHVCLEPGCLACAASAGILADSLMVQGQDQAGRDVSGHQCLDAGCGECAGTALVLDGYGVSAARDEVGDCCLEPHCVECGASAALVDGVAFEATANPADPGLQRAGPRDFKPMLSGLASPAATIPNTWGSLDSLGPPGGEAQEPIRAVEPKKFSLSRLHAYPAEPRHKVFAVRDDPLVDAARLGVDVVRKAAAIGLRWGHLTKEAEDVDYTLPGERVPLDLAKLELDVGASENVDDLVKLLVKSAENDLKVILRPIHPGSAGEDNPGRPSDECNTDPESWDDREKRSALVFLWDEEHLFDIDDAGGGHRTPEGNRFPADAGNATACQYHLDALDISSPYKREYMQYIGESIGKLLVDVATELDRRSPGRKLSDVIDGFEFLNEADAKTLYERWEFVGTGPSGVPLYEKVYDPERSGEYVGATFFRMAWGLRKILRTAPDLIGDIPMLLPALASYNIGVNPPHSWESKLEYLWFLAHGIVEELGLARSHYSSGDSDRVDYDDLVDLVQEIDYHWYHREGGPLHIAYLVHEVDEVRQLIGEAFDDALEVVDADVDHLMGKFNDTKVRIHEGGVSLGETDTVPGAWRGDGELWQAHEVFRRLGGQLASAASQAGWWSLISGKTDDFEGTGLRKEPDPGTIYWRDDPGATNAWDAGLNAQRLSWFAYRRMSELLRHRVRSGRMLLPRSTSRADIPAATVDRATCPGVVVFEYTLMSRGPDDPKFAYLVLNDDNGGVGVSTVLATPAARGTVAEVVPLMPNLEADSPPHTQSDDLPFREVAYAASEYRELPTKVDVGVAQDPVFLYSQTPLTWTCYLAASDTDLYVSGVPDVSPSLLEPDHERFQRGTLIDPGDLLLDSWLDFARGPLFDREDLLLYDWQDGSRGPLVDPEDLLDLGWLDATSGALVDREDWLHLGWLAGVLR